MARVLRKAGQGADRKRWAGISKKCKVLYARRKGTFSVNSDEMRVLREGVGKTMVFLRSVPNVAIARAGPAAVREFNRTGVLRV